MIRQTRQREALFKALKEAGRPLAALELFELARQHAPRIGLRTVYRQIRELVAEGRLVGVDFPGQPPRYALVSRTGHHPHLICNLCQKVFELPCATPDIPFEAPDGWKVTGEELILYGQCANPASCRHRYEKPSLTNDAPSRVTIAPTKAPSNDV
jgi:Fur family transcriptional regulator, ferric uptake regulator